MNERSDELVELRVRANAGAARSLGVGRQWQRVGVVPSAEHAAQQRRLRRAFPPRDFALDARYVNPSAATLTHHHIPARTVQLGRVLDMTTVLGELATTWDSELAGWVMLTDARAEQMRPGVAALYLVRRVVDAGEPTATAAQEETYEMWHKREPGETLTLDVPDFCGVYIGTARVIGYDSDKWTKRGKSVHYEHDFRESGREPEVWADAENLAHARGVVIRGGDMRVTAEGID
jgi:hypothetical protein